MSALSKWKGRKTVASAVVVAVVVGVPVTIAALHPGFPVTDVSLTSRDVWVTNSQQLLGGRLNRQIDELNGSVVASSPDFDVLQDGDNLFMSDPDNGKVEAVDPASTLVSSSVDVPKGSEISYGGDMLAIVSPAGDLWAISSVGDLHFNYATTPPIEKLGKDGHATITKTGVIVAVSPSKQKLYRVSSIAATPEVHDFPSVGQFQIAGVGDQAVIFDQSTNKLVTENGTKYALPAQGLRLQQTGEASNYAVVATADSLLEVDLGNGSVRTVKADVSTPAKNADGVAAPVFLDGCVHGAWAAAQRYVLACDGKGPQTQDIAQPTAGDHLEFRVNRSVIVLNNLDNGNAWVLSDNMRLVDNWSDVTPPDTKDNDKTSDQKSATQSFEDTLAQRTDVNRPPVAVDDDFGIRPGRTTILSVLDNDSDPDGDVLVISKYDSIDQSTGHLDPIDGSRALQFTPAAGFVGTIQFDYTIDDGRGGTATARVTARVVPENSNQEPVALRDGNVSVEANQTVSYNVLTNWRDPDGDDLYLISAAPKSGDLVRFTPDGLVTFTSQTSELGKKQVVFQVSDGRGAPVEGTLTVDVEAAGSLKPVGTPDFASTFTNETTVVKPLTNDLSPSGAQLALAAMDAPGSGATASFNSDRGEVTFTSGKAGVYYIKYTLQAGAESSVGLIRIDVQDRPANDQQPPVAVKDTAYLRGDQPTTVDVLSNDVSPSGRVLAVQSVSVPPQYSAKGLVVELLASTEVRVTSPAALTEQVDFTYTISDGLHTATAGVTVVPVPALTKHQPPVAANDAAKVRAGDVITVDVLANDFHPDDSPMTLDTTLVTPPTAGLAFVSDNELRYQAPTTPGQYTVGYRVLDPFGNTATATVTFTVTPLDQKGNQDPVPQPIVGRVLAGGSIRVDVPLDGIDPDGDSVQLLSFPTGPSLGTVSETGPNYFIYDASAGAAGTDTFSYEVYDTYGATGTATVKIAVIPPPAELQPPNAAPDSVSIRPGRIAQVDLLANDSDPQGAPIKASKKLIDVPKGIDAQVLKQRYLVITAPQTVQSFSLRYTLTNDRGGSAVSYVLVKVTPDAPILPPTAEDIPILTKDVAGKKTVTVDVFDGHAFNPSGVTEDMGVSVEGPNADAAKVLAQNGKIQVTPGPKRQAIAYRVTNKQDKLTATAFILVPAAVSTSFDDPPMIDPTLPVQYVSMNETKQWNLKDILKVPSGRDAWIYDKATVSSIEGDGGSNYVDKDTITFTPKKDYRGPASINFSVTDGASKDDPKGNKANLRLNIVVGDPQYRDTPPVFTTPNVQVEQGETSTIDLRDSTGHPNPQILQEVTYSDITGADNGLKASLNGSELSLTTPRNAKKGTAYTLGVTLKWDKFVVQGTIHVTVVGSTRPLAVAVSDNYEGERSDPPLTVHPLVNDSNPFQTTGEPLKIIGAKVDNTGKPATISFTDDSIKITSDPATKSGNIVIIYTIEDATQDQDRDVNGTVTLTISDVPDQGARPVGGSIGDDGTASFTFSAPAANGKAITSYDILTNTNGSPTPTQPAPTNCIDGATCTVGGLSNGHPYTFEVRAVNANGPGGWSPESAPITPYGQPGQVQPNPGTATGWSPSGSIKWTWPAVAGTGGTTTYAWTAKNSGGTSVGSGSGVDLTSATVSGLSAGSYTITVQATNQGGRSGPAGTSSAVTIQNQTVPAKVTGVGGTVTDDIQPGAIRWSWNAVGGGAQVTDNLVYYYSFDGGALTSNGGSTTVTTSGLAAGSHSLSVEARNNAGAGQRSDTATVGGISNPQPSVELCKAPSGSVRGIDSGGLPHDGVQYANIVAGDYKIWTDSSTHNTYSVGTTGSIAITSYHGNGEPALTVHMVGVSNGQSYTSTLSRTTEGAPPCN